MSRAPDWDDPEESTRCVRQSPTPAILGAARDMFDPEWLTVSGAGLIGSERSWRSPRSRRVRDYLRMELASLKPAVRVAAKPPRALDAERDRARDRILATSTTRAMPDS